MTVNMTIKDKDGARFFLKEEAVFKITKLLPGRSEGIVDHGMVNTKSDYEKKLADHQYISILMVAPLTYKLAYLYGCLNFKKGTPRAEVFTFHYRMIGKRDWVEWFSVNPYTD